MEVKLLGLLLLLLLLLLILGAALCDDVKYISKRNSASGGSSLLNLDFFGPVEESESGDSSIPGVDPELFELTTSKLDSNKMSDAFARLMSSVQATSTTRKPRPEEKLSEEALKIICRFPDLSFMTAKVLMFPTTLTPHTDPQH